MRTETTLAGLPCLLCGSRFAGCSKRPEVCDPERYDSPEMFRHGKEIYMVARGDIGGLTR